MRGGRGVRRRSGAWVLLAVAKDEATAEQWQALLAAEGIDAQIRVDDPARAGMPSRVGFPLGYMEPGLSLFSYPCHVRPHERRAARQVLRQHADLDGPSVDRSLVTGALLVMAGSLALVVLLLLFEIRI